MRIELILLDGEKVEAILPHEGAKYVCVPGRSCECSRGQNLEVAGGRPAEKDGGRVVEADAACIRCHGLTGRLVVELETIFGPEEDAAVLHGRPRVY